MIDIWFFWNHCYAGKHYPRRPIVRKIVSRHFRKVICSDCGQSMISYKKSNRHEKLLCRQCRDAKKEQIRQSEMSTIRKKSEKKILEFEDRLSDCEKFGTCDILAAHHDILAEDPDRLSTDFLIGIICGESGKSRYLKNGKALFDGIYFAEPFSCEGDH